MMKFVTLFFSGALLVMLSACAIQSPEMNVVTAGPAVPKPLPNKALVIFARPSWFGGANQSTIYDGKHYIGTLSAKTRIAYQATPGKHIFMVVSETSDFLRATLQSGKTYYVEVFARPGILKARFGFRPQNGQVSQGDIQKWLHDTKQVTVNARGLEWFKANKQSVMRKRAADLPRWLNKPAGEQQTLYAASGSS